MHEMSMAIQLVEQLERLGRDNGVRRVVEVDVRCGVMLQVVPEALQAAFEAASEGTIAQGAALNVTEEPLAARCRACGARYKPGIDDYLCPQCGQADVEVEAGRDMILQSVVCDADDRTSV